MRPPEHAPLSATVSTVGTTRLGRGPLGALPALSAAARRALTLVGVLALLNAAALVAQAFLLASVLASIVDGDTGDLTARLAVLVGIVPVRAVVGWATRVVSARAAAGAKEELRAKVVDHALRLGPERVAARGPAQLTELTTKGLDALDAYFTDYLPALVTAAVVPLAAGAAVLLADWPSAVIVALTVPLLPVFAILVGKYTADRVAGATEAAHRLSGHLLELIRALPVLTAFRRAEAQAEAVRRVSDRHRTATMATLRVAFASAFVLELAATLSVALVAVLIGVRLVHGDLTLAIGLGVLILAPECYQPLRAVGAAFHASADGVEAVRRVADVLAEPVPEPGTVRPGRGEVRVSGLRVRRRGGFAPDGETFTVRPGSTVRLRSPSGAGKSTTLAVLLGFASPAEGTVTIDGTPLAGVDMSMWRESVAWVPQFPAFAGGTVRAELELAVPRQPTVDELSSVLEALWLGGIVDESISQLSTGQRQRVAVARALLRLRQGAWLLLLDEPTAHLDARHAALVYDAIAAAERDGAAVVLAAHPRSASPLAKPSPLATSSSAGLAKPPAPPARPAQPLSEPENRASAQPSADVSRAGEQPARPLPLRHLLHRRLLTGAGLGAAALLAGIALTAISGWLIAKAAGQPPILTLTVAVVGVRAFGLARAVLRYAERLATHDGAFRVAARLRVRLWRSLVRLGPARTIGLRRGEGQRRLTTDIDTVRDLLPRAVTPPLVAATVLAGAVLVQVAVLPGAGLALAGSVALAAVLAPALSLRLERRATSALARGRREVAASVLTLFDSAAELVAFGAHRTLRRELADADAGLARTARRQAFGAGAAEALITLATGSAALAGAWLGAAAVAAGTIDPVLAPVLALVPLALTEVLAPLPVAARHWDTLRDARTRLAAHEPERRERAVRDTECPDHGVRPFGFRDADIRWPGAGEPVLRGVDLRLAAGAHVAVVGQSGAGKSTLGAALLGFLQPERGTAALPGTVAWAPQEPQLVSTTVAENLRLADPHATDQQLAEALRLVELPDLALDTILDSAGAGLSGGQAQRVSLARALLLSRSADLVLLDEPTAHLDADTARAVRAHLRVVLAGKTVVHITHRPEEAAEADVVLEVRDGSVLRAAAPGDVDRDRLVTR